MPKTRQGALPCKQENQCRNEGNNGAKVSGV